MNTRIIREKCIGCTLCAAVCPSVYKMDDEDKAIVILEDVPADLADEVRDAADGCPTEAIEIEE